VDAPFGLTLRWIILLHLMDYRAVRSVVPTPIALTQKGIVEITGANVGTISRLLQDLIREGLVEEELSRVGGAPRKKKTYWLTPDGVTEAESVIAELRVRTVIVDGERRKLGDLLDRLDGTHLWSRVVLLAESLFGEVIESAEQPPEPAPTKDEVVEDLLVPSAETEAEAEVYGVDQFMRSVNEVYGHEVRFRTGSGNHETMWIGSLFHLVKLHAQMAGARLHTPVSLSPITYWPFVPLIISLIFTFGTFWMAVVGALAAIEILFLLATQNRVKRVRGTISSILYKAGRQVYG